jgi:hypothetical protein
MVCKCIREQSLHGDVEVMFFFLRKIFGADIHHHAGISAA